jgi:hypothetical protein
MTRLSKPDYVMGKLLYFLRRFSPQARLDFMRRALVEVGKLPGGYGVEVHDVRPALPAHSVSARRRGVTRSS